MDLHVKSNRLYIQCINDPLIYAIETTSAIVIQTVKYTDETDIMPMRNTFTMSSCGSLIFTTNCHEDQIKCFRISDGVCVGHIRIPISLMVKKYAVTSLAYHPNKNVIACSIFGSSIRSCLFLMCNETDDDKKEREPFIRDEEDYVERDISGWHDLRSQGMMSMSMNEMKPTEFESILNRIDELFFLAIRSPNHMEDAKGQLIDVQSLLHNFSMATLQESPSDRRNNEKGSANDMSSRSLQSEQSKTKIEPFGESTKTIEFLQELKALQSSKLIKSNSKAIDSESSSSRHTFQVERKFNSNKKSKSISNLNEKIEADLSNATYSIESDASKHSNLTFEIEK